MFARTPHCAAVHLRLAGTTNVHQVASGGVVAPDRPLSDWWPWGPVLMPSEKLDPSGPGSLTAVPDSLGFRALSQAETVNDRRVSIRRAGPIASCPGAEIERAPPNGLWVQPAPPRSLRDEPATESVAVVP